MASPYRNIYFQLYFTQKIHYSDQNGNFHFGQPIGGIAKKKKKDTLKRSMCKEGYYFQNA